jgi:hypothetical protein
MKISPVSVGAQLTNDSIENIIIWGVRLMILIAVLFVLAYVVFVAATCLMCRGLDRQLKTCFPLTKRPPF